LYERLLIGSYWSAGILDKHWSPIRYLWIIDAKFLLLTKRLIPRVPRNVFSRKLHEVA